MNHQNQSNADWWDWLFSSSSSLPLQSGGAVETRRQRRQREAGESSSAAEADALPPISSIFQNPLPTSELTAPSRSSEALPPPPPPSLPPPPPPSLPPPPSSTPSVLNLPSQPSTSSTSSSSPQPRLQSPPRESGADNSNVNVDGVDRSLNDGVGQTREDEGGGAGVNNPSRPLSPTRLPFSHSNTHPLSPSALTSASADESRAEAAEEETVVDGESFSIGYQVTLPKIFKNRSAISFRAIPNINSGDYMVDFAKFKEEIIPFLEKERKNRYSAGMKIHISNKVLFHVIKNDSIADQPTPNFTTKSLPVYREDDIRDIVAEILDKLMKLLIDYVARGSNFVYQRVIEFTVTLCKFSPFFIGQYIPTPPSVEAKKATINVLQPTGYDANFCFIDSLSAVLYPAPSNPNRVNHYRDKRSLYNIEGLTLPITLKTMRQFEKKNSSLSINVYGVDLKQSVNQSPVFYPISISSNRGSDKKVANLLLLERGEERHFVAIKNLSKLTRRLKSRNRSANTACCPYCLNHVTISGDAWDRHISACSEYKPCATIYPPEGSTLSFKDEGRSTQAEFLLVGDMETREVPVSTVSNRPEAPLDDNVQRPFQWIRYLSELEHCVGDPSKKKKPCALCNPAKPCWRLHQSTQLRCRLELFSWSYKIVSDLPEDDFPLRLYQREDADRSFLIQLKKDLREIKSKLSRHMPIHWTPETRRRHEEQQSCEKCHRRFSADVVKTADHHHRSSG